MQKSILFACKKFNFIIDMLQRKLHSYRATAQQRELNRESSTELNRESSTELNRALDERNYSSQLNIYGTSVYDSLITYISRLLIRIESSKGYSKFM